MNFLIIYESDIKGETLDILLLIIFLIIGAIVLLFLSTVLGLMLYTGVCFVINFLILEWQGKVDDKLEFDDILGDPYQKKHVIGSLFSIVFVAIGLIFWDGIFKYSFIESLVTLGFLMFFLLFIGSIIISKLKDRKKL